MAAPTAGRQTGNQLIASNRRARHDYAILNTYEAGIVLSGSEVKSLRAGQAQLADAYARVLDHQIWLDGVHIAPYSFAHGLNGHEPTRSRKLLMHASEIRRLKDRVQQEHLALVPLSLYFKDGRVKVELGLAKGHTKADKRQTLAKNDADREIRDAVGRHAKGRD
jgi:SsrA-binding protein